MRELFAGILGASFLVACGSSDSGGSNTATDGTGGAAGSGAAAGGSSAAGSTAAGGSTSSTGGTASAGSTSAGGAAAGGSDGMGGSGTGGTGSTTFPSTFGTYIELGDSISDMTQVAGNQPPFFYNLLFQNDDTTYPAWAGMDLKTKFGVQQHVHASKAGSTGQDMKAQVTGLSATLPTPILVTVTIGGNDITGAAIDIIQMKDQPDRDKLRAQIAGYLADLKTKFGPDVYVMQADIYDPSDGKGDFAKAGCGGTLALLPMMPTDTFFMNWNQVVDEEVPKLDHGVVSPLHEVFKGHGISAGADRWFLGDCIHPTKAGHQALRRMFWKTLTGQDGPALRPRKSRARPLPRRPRRLRDDRSEPGRATPRPPWPAHRKR